VLDGLLLQVEFAPDLLVAEPLRDKPKDLLLAMTEPVERIGLRHPRGLERTQDARGKARGHIGRARRDAAAYRPFEAQGLPGQPIALWLRTHTGKDALVMLPPDFSRFSDTFTLWSRRSVFFSFKNMPFSEHGVRDWSERGGTLLGRKFTGEMSYESFRGLWQVRDAASIVGIAEANGICYLVDRVADRGDFPGRPIVTQRVEDAVWGLWRIPGTCGAGASVDG